MFLYLSEYLIEWFSPLNAFTYITTRGILAALTALVMSFLFGPKIIEKLQEIDGKMAFTNLAGIVEKTFNIMGITKYCEIYDSVDAGVQKLS